MKLVAQVKKAANAVHEKVSVPLRGFGYETGSNLFL